MNIREISPAETISLRHEVLRPGKNVSTCFFEGDDAPDTRHFGAVDAQNNIVGIVSVFRKDNPAINIGNEPGTELYQIRAMATAASYRSLGLGRLLLTSAEKYANSRGSTLIWANARSSAIELYIKQGYSVASEEFDIEGVGPHYVVTKSLGD